ncbi:hypothetical protein F5X99DRAFT_368538 [Biscogniauxia marginata]|nr:hypothetical protein F5X99DRAFT_368538 [Biscogniauxia marginata]
MGLGPAPQNYSLPLVSRVEIAGPAAAADPQRPGTVCLPYVPVSGGYGVRVGDAATIQVVERADNEASVYSCVDIIFADQADVAGPDQTNCFNSTSITFVSSSTSDATSSTGDMWGIGTSSGSRARIFASKTGSTTATLTSTSTPAQTNIATGTTGRDAFPDSLLLVGLLVALCWRLYV